MSHLDFSNITVEKLDNLINDYMKKMIEFNDLIANMDNASLTWQSYIQFNIDYYDEFRDSVILIDMSSFHVDKEIRDKCSECETKLSQFDIAQSMRKDLFEKFKYYYNNQYNIEKVNFSDERIRYIEKEMKEYKKMGLELPNDKYNQVKDIKQEISKLSNDFSQNLNNYDKTFELSKEELEGMQENWLNTRVIEDKSNLYKVTLKYPDYVPIMENCKVRNTRKMINHEFIRRCYDENKPICDKIFILRNELGKLLGYEIFSDYQLENRMAKNTDNVLNFLNDLAEKVKPLVLKDYESILSISKEDGINTIDDLRTYDISYYSRVYTERESELDMEYVKQYFNIDTVISGTFSIYETLLGFKFIDISEENKNKFWHEDVKLFKVINNIDGKIGEEQGQFFLDLYPRSGKFGHAAVFPIQRGCKKYIPVCIMACNFPKSENLSFDDVQTFFHEFGHVMHGIASRPEISSLAGTAVARDAVECPSQMLEEWCYRSNALKIMSPDIPDEVIIKLIKQKNMLQGYFNARQLSFGILDMELHGKSYNVELYNGDYNAFYSKIHKEMLLLDLPENHGFIQTFGHLMGYQAGYYGYLYSKVFAVCMFEEKFKDHELDPVVGMEYRNKIIAPGNTKDFMELLIDFLGHEPTNNAFIKSLLE